MMQASVKPTDHEDGAQLSQPAGEELAYLPIYLQRDIIVPAGHRFRSLSKDCMALFDEKVQTLEADLSECAGKGLTMRLKDPCHLPALQSMYLSGDFMYQLDLKPWGRLRVLRVKDMPNLGHLALPPSMPHLQQLQVSCPRLQTLELPATMPELVDLQLDVGQDVMPLAGLVFPKLTRLVCLAGELPVQLVEAHTGLCDLAFSTDSDALDCSKLPSLTSLSCAGSTSLMSLQGLSSCKSLTSLDCSNTPVAVIDAAAIARATSINISRCPNLGVHPAFMGASTSKLKTLSLSANTSECAAYLPAAAIASVTQLVWVNGVIPPGTMREQVLHQCTSLVHLDLESTSHLKVLNVTGMPNLKTLVCPKSGHLRTLDCSGLPQLQDLDCARCPLLSTVQLQGCSQLSKLRINGTHFLGELDCQGLPLPELDLRECKSLRTLNVSRCSELQRLLLQDCKSLETLDCSGLASLASLHCDGCTSLSSLALSGCSNLSSLSVQGCRSLTSLDCGGLPLETIECGSTSNMKSLRLAGCKQLGKALKLDGCSKLAVMECSGAGMEELIVSGADSLVNLGLAGASNVSHGLMMLVDVVCR